MTPRGASQPTRFYRTVHAVLLLAAIAYGCLFIYKTSFVIGGERYFVLFDDAMVAMRYAQNLANGHGFVWNPGGQQVEGYTNPLWTLYMSLWHLAPISASKISLPIQLSGLVILTANLVVIGRIAAIVSTSEAVRLGAVFLTAFYYPLVNWTLQGMEVGLIALITSLTVYWLLLALHRRSGYGPIYWLMAVGLFVRLDFLVVAAAVVAFAAWHGSMNRKHLIQAALILGGALTVQSILRLWYYGDIFPNTYYLKMTGYPLIGRLQTGAVRFVDFVMDASPTILLAPTWLLVTDRRRPAILLATVFAVEASYSIYVGGDAWEWWGGSNRYLSSVMPLLFVLIAAGIVRYVQTLSDHLRSGNRSEATKYGVRLGFALMLLVVNITATQTSSIFGIAGWAIGLTAVMLGIGFFGLRAAPRNQPHLGYLNRLVLPILVLTTVSLNCTGLRPLETWFLIADPPQVEDNLQMVRRALVIQAVTTPEARIGVVWAGIIPYFSRRPAVDFLGKTDPVIAHRHANRLAGRDAFWPGHIKWDYRYSIGELKPDVILQIWPQNDPDDPFSLAVLPPDVLAVIGTNYRKVSIDGMLFCFRVDSRHIRWETIASAKTS